MNNHIPEHIIAEVDKELDIMFADHPKGLGFCHIAELNPHIIYD